MGESMLYRPCRTNRIMPKPEAGTHRDRVRRWRWPFNAAAPGAGMETKSKKAGDSPHFGSVIGKVKAKWHCRHTRLREVIV
jgi:hypothetical protein